MYEYHKKVVKNRMAVLQRMNDEELYDTANGYDDFEHGVGYYSRDFLIKTILKQEYKI